jgi:4a-hydroxytetrahydrobiopterin dehydratase
MTKLSASEVAKRLKLLKGWKRDGDFITKTFRFKTFMDGIRFVNDVAEVAEKQEHHPDIHIIWTTIKLQIQTHDEGGITNWDFDLAEAIEGSLKR